MPQPSLANAVRSSGLVRQGLAAYYRMGAGAGTVSEDVSGNGRHATLGVSGANLPTRTATPGLAFNNSVLALPTHFFTRVGTIQVACSTTVGGNAQIIVCPDGTDQAARLAPGSNQMCFGAYPNPTTIGGTAIQGPNLLTWTIGAKKPGEVRLWCNDTPEVSYPFGPGQAGMSATAGDTKLYAGFQNAGSPSLLGEAYSVLLYQRPLSDREVRQNYAFLKNDLAARGITLGITFPKNSNQARILGDSLIQGVGVTSTAGNAGLTLPLGNLLTNPVVMSNLGVPGIAAQTLSTTLAGPIADPLWSQYTGAIKVCGLQGGTNDLANNLQTPAAIYNYIKVNALARLAAGATHVCIEDVIPRGDATWLANGALETNRQTLNGLFAADFPTNISGLVYGGSSWGGSAVVYYRASAEPNLQDPTNATYFAADRLHNTAAGNSVRAGGGWIAMLNYCGLT